MNELPLTCSSKENGIYTKISTGSPRGKSKTFNLKAICSVFVLLGAIAIPEISAAQTSWTPPNASICRSGQYLNSFSCDPTISPSVTPPMPDYAIGIGAGSTEHIVAHGASFGSGSIANRIAITPADNYVGKGTASVNATVASTRAAFSVGSDVSGSSFTRQITNVAAGSQDTDAVNVAQLKALTMASGAVHYFSVNSSLTGAGSNFDNDGARGSESIAIGSFSMAGNDTVQPIAAVAMGHYSNAVTSGSIAIGANSKAGRDNIPGITDQRTAIGKANNIALGLGAVADGGRVISIGEYAGIDTVDNWNIENVNIGTKAGALSKRDYSVAIGFEAGALDKAAQTEQLTKITIDGDRSPSIYIGKQAGSNTISYGNMAIGSGAGGNIRDERSRGNVLFGAEAGYGISSDDGKNASFIGFGPGANTLIGNKSGYTMVGDGNVAIGNLSGAVGTNKKEARGDNNVYMGHLAGAGASSDRTIIIGSQAGDSTSNDRSILIGNFANGNVTTATRNVIAVGSESQALGNESIAFGFNTRARASNAMALGRGASAGISGGTISNDIAIGTAAQATGGASIAQGNTAKALGASAIAMGDGAQAHGNNSIALGTGNKVFAKNAGAFGDPTIINIGADGSYAVGNNNTVNAADAFVMGSDVTADLAGSVILGKASDGTTASKYVQTTSATLNSLTYGGFAGAGTLTDGSVVSIGAAGAERQIKNVAAGQISATSTDAINGSQLHATNAVLGNVANSTKNILGGNASLAVDGTITMTNIGDTGENTVHDAIKNVKSNIENVEIIASKGWNISANGATAAKVVPGGLVDFNNTDGNLVISRTGTNITHNLDPNLKIGESVTIGGDTTNQTIIKEGNVTTKNLTVTNETKLGDNFWVTNEGDVHYNGPITNDTHIVNKQYVDNSIGDVTEIANKGWNISANGAAAEKVAPGATVDFNNTDTNIVVTRTGTNITHDLNPNLKIGESITIGGDTTNQTIIKQGNVTTNTINVGGGTMVVNEGSVSIKEGTTVNMGGNRITNVAPGVNNGDAVTVSQLKAVTGDIGSLRGDLNRIDRDSRAGTASAAAMANLPQAYLPGKSMFAIATAGHRGQQGYAVGLSTLSEGGDWVLKGSVSGNSRGHVTYGAGVGYQW